MMIKSSSAITVVRCNKLHDHPTKYDNNTFVRTNVLADYLDKFTNINMVSISENDDSEHQCKYMAQINCLIIIFVLAYMFFDKTDDV